MGNSTKYVRSTLKTEHCGNSDRLIIEFDANDNGQINVNSEPMNTNGRGNWVGAVRFVVQMIETFNDDLSKKSEASNLAA